MVQRPILVLSLVVLAAAAVKAAVVGLSPSAAANRQDNGAICTACGPIRADAPLPQQAN